MRSIADAVAAGDLDELIRLVDGLAAAREWDGIVDLRDRSRHALETRGLQLWPAAEYAEYRLALDAPAPYACDVVTEHSGRFAHGPLWEVAASRLPWAELREHLEPGPARALAAHERVLRGEDLSADDTIDTEVLEMPLALGDWEPTYATATYHPDRVEFERPPPPPLEPSDLPPPASPLEDHDSVEALLDIGAVWAQQSNGSARAVVVSGSPEAAISTLGHDRCRMAAVDASEAMRLMAWAASDGGAYGRRRGSPVGRFAAWWVVAALADLGWPVQLDRVRAAAESLAWAVWEPESFSGGWTACLTVAHPDGEIAWAVEALDTWREGDQPE